MYVSALAVFAVINPCIANPKNVTSPSPQKPEIRKLKFATDRPYGRLNLVTVTLGGKSDFGSSESVAVAKGDVSITVAPGHAVILELNPGVFAAPQCIDTMPTEGIDGLKACTLAMDENDQAAADHVLQHLPHFKNLKYLDISRSDASDAGLSKLGEMTKLQYIDSFMTAVRGSCFKQFSFLPDLVSLNFDQCSLDQTQLVHFQSLKHLQRLQLGSTRIDSAGVNNLANCSSLTMLKLTSNPKIDDQCLTTILSMKHLKRLLLGGTSISVKGIEQLKVLPLEQLTLPLKSYPPTTLVELHRIFPHTDLLMRTGKVKPDDKVIFAPL